MVTPAAGHHGGHAMRASGGQVGTRIALVGGAGKTWCAWPSNSVNARQPGQFGGTVLGSVGLRLTLQAAVGN